MSKQNILNPVLDELLSKNNDIQSALVATSDGIEMGSVNLNKVSNRLSAMASASLGLGRQLVSTVCEGNLKEITVNGDKGQVFIYSITTRAVLVVVTKENPNVALVNWESHKIVKQIAEIL